VPPKPAVPPTPTMPPPTIPPPTPTPRPQRGAAMTTPDFSVHVFLWGAFETTQRDLRLVREMGFGWVKQRFEWRYIEPHIKGRYDWGEPDRIVNAIDQAELKVIARIDNQPKWTRKDNSWPTPGPPDNMADWGDFMHDMAARYKGRIQAYEIWNEPNLAREWGDEAPSPKGYVEMLKVAHTAIKKADPAALVITAGLSPTTASGKIALPDIEFTKAMYAAGAREYFDMLGVHAPGFKATPEMSPDDIAKDPKLNHGEGAAGRIYGFRHAEDIRAVMVANGDAAKRAAILEFGWTSDPRPASPYFWHAVSEEEKADYLVRAFEYAKKHWQPWIGAMTVIYIADPAWSKDHEQYHWSITGPDGSLRPAFKALSQMKKDAPAAPLMLPASAIPASDPTKPASAPAKQADAAAKPSNAATKPAAATPVPAKPATSPAPSPTATPAAKPKVATP